MTIPRCLAMIPARAGSKRVPGKNLMQLLPSSGHPLLAYAVVAAVRSGAYCDVLVSSEDAHTLDVAQRYGAIPIKRPQEYAQDGSPDIEWVLHALDTYSARHEPPEMFSIVRVTNPFRKPATLAGAVRRFAEVREGFDSLRAIAPAKSHPWKCWALDHGLDGGGFALVEWCERTYPALWDGKAPPHSSATQTLPAAYVQTAAVEVANVATATVGGTIAGDRILGYMMADPIEALDINSELDVILAQALLERGLAQLPMIEWYRG